MPGSNGYNVSDGPAFAAGARPASLSRAEQVPRELHEVWEHNLDAEFDALLAAVASAGGSDAFLALDTEFPGFPVEDPQFSSHAVHYQALRKNVDQLWPIQLGLAVVGANGVHRGVWTFNLRFDAEVDAHTEDSMVFLRSAGLNFPRHRTEGVSAMTLGQRLKNSRLIGHQGQAPCWLTFSGSYDWGYLLKLVTLGRPLPGVQETFDQVLSVYCPKRSELRDLLPKGSLEMLGRRHGIKRWGHAHTAGSDALLTLELFMLLEGHKGDAGIAKQQKILSQQQEDWSDVSSQNSQEWSDGRSSSQTSIEWPTEVNWHQNVNSQWYPETQVQWYSGEGGVHQSDVQVDSSTWETSWGNDIQPQKLQMTNANLGWGDSSHKIQMINGNSNSGWGDTWVPQQSQTDNEWWYSNQTTSLQPTWYATL